MNLINDLRRFLTKVVHQGAGPNGHLNVVCKLYKSITVDLTWRSSTHHHMRGARIDRDVLNLLSIHKPMQACLFHATFLHVKHLQEGLATDDSDPADCLACKSESIDVSEFELKLIWRVWTRLPVFIQVLLSD